MSGFKKTRFIFSLFLAIVLILPGSVFPALAEAGTSSSDAKDTSKDTAEQTISVNVRNTDIRDVLSAIAVNMGTDIFFIGQPTNINFSIQDVTPSTALDYLLKSVSMSYIKSGSIMIVGTRDTLTKDFFTNIALTKFSLKYIKSDVIAAQIDALGISVQKLTLDSNKNAIWVQGLPQELGKVRELISMLDRTENASVTSTASTTLMLTPIALSFITADQLNGILSEMNLPRGIIIDGNPKTLWVYGSNSEIAQINDVRKKVDIAENAQNENLLLSIKTLKYVTAEEIQPIISELGVGIKVITFNRSAQTIWLEGDEASIKQVSAMIDKIDTDQNANNNVLFVYKFTNITAREAQTRMSNLQLPGIKVYTFNFPQFVKSMMVFCPQDYKSELTSLFAKIDVMTEKIKVPVDYADGSSGSSLLQARRDLIVSMTGIPASSFTISGNVSRTSDTPHYIMYLEETSEVIQSVKELIKFIDNPTNDGQTGN